MFLGVLAGVWGVRGLGGGGLGGLRGKEVWVSGAGGVGWGPEVGSAHVPHTHGQCLEVIGHCCVLCAHCFEDIGQCLWVDRKALRTMVMNVC